MISDEIEFTLEQDIVPMSVGTTLDTDKRSELALQMLKHMHQSLTHVIQLMEDGDSARATRDMVNMVMGKKSLEQRLEEETGTRMVEGVFDGVSMIANDGMRYVVPENYASKSKLVEGDMMKLILKSDGRHIFKQIGPVERRRVVGVLDVDTLMNTPIVIAGEDMYKVLAASVTYHKGVPGDEVVVLLPGSGKSAWAALERVVGK